MMMGTLSLVQKGQTSGCSECGICSGIAVYGGGNIVFGAKTSNQWTQYTVDAVVYDSWDIVFDAKRSNQWMQWMQYTHWNSCIWWWGHCLWCKKVKSVDAVEWWYMVMHPLCTLSIYHYSTASTGLTFLHQKQCSHHHIPLFHCIHWFDLFGSKTTSPPPYTTIPLHPLRPLIHCVLRPLRPPLRVTFV